MSSSQKLVVFDWNGTLLADVQAIFEVDNQLFEFFGGQRTSLANYRNTVDIPAIELYVANGCDRKRLIEQSVQLSEKFHTLYEERASTCRSRRGAREVLEWLKEGKTTSIILSNHSNEGIHSQLERLRLAPFISSVLANDVLGAAMMARNKCERLEKYIAENKMDPKNVIIIGDSPEEAEIGRKLGITSVLITNGYYATHRLRAANPDHLVDSLSQFQKIVSQRLALPLRPSIERVNRTTSPAKDETKRRSREL